MHRLAHAEPAEYFDARHMRELLARRGRRDHRRRLGPHHFVISDIARGRRANPRERGLYRGAISDDRLFHTFEAIGSRWRSPATLFAPRTLWQIARAA